MAIQAVYWLVVPVPEQADADLEATIGLLSVDDKNHT